MTSNASTATLATLATLATPTVKSRLLGDLVVSDHARLDFPRGLLGLAAQRGFALVTTEREGLYWLQSLQEPALTFLLADPFLFFPQLTVDVSDPDVAAIGATTPSDVLLLAIVTMGSTDTPATANLQGPLVINLRTRLGRQIAVADPLAPVRAPLDLALSKVA